MLSELFSGGEGVLADVAFELCGEGFCSWGVVVGFAANSSAGLESATGGGLVLGHFTHRVVGMS